MWESGGIGDIGAYKRCRWEIGGYRRMGRWLQENGRKEKKVGEQGSGRGWGRGGGEREEGRNKEGEDTNIYEREMWKRVAG